MPRRVVQEDGRYHGFQMQGNEVLLHLKPPLNKELSRYSNAARSSRPLKSSCPI